MNTQKHTSKLAKVLSLILICLFIAQSCAPKSYYMPGRAKQRKVKPCDCPSFSYESLKEDIQQRTA